jgi:hypothetical protein
MWVLERWPRAHGSCQQPRRGAAAPSFKEGCGLHLHQDELPKLVSVARPGADLLRQQELTNIDDTAGRVMHYDKTVLAAALREPQHPYFIVKAPMKETPGRKEVPPGTMCHSGAGGTLAVGDEAAVSFEFRRRPLQDHDSRWNARRSEVEPR